MSEYEDKISNYNANDLARLADCGTPGTLDGTGAKFLESIRDALVEEWSGPGSISDRFMSELCDGAPSVYTSELWLQFVEVSAYREDLEELGAATFEFAAAGALVSIAQRLATALRAELEEGASDEPTYEVVRFYQRPDLEQEVIFTGLTLDEAREHCNDPQSSSSTATGAEALERTSTSGEWFDGYRAE